MSTSNSRSLGAAAALPLRFTLLDQQKNRALGSSGPMGYFSIDELQRAADELGKVRFRAILAYEPGDAPWFSFAWRLGKDAPAQRSVPGTTEDILRFDVEAVTLDGGTATTMTLPAGVDGDGIDDYYAYRSVIEVTNDLPPGVDGLTRRIDDFDGTSRVATIDTMVPAPIAGTTINIHTHPRTVYTAWQMLSDLFAELDDNDRWLAPYVVANGESGRDDMIFRSILLEVE